MKKTIYILFVGILILSLLACSPSEEDASAGKNANQSQQSVATPEPVIQLQVSDARNEELKGTVVPIQAESIGEKDYNVSIIGANFDKSTGDTMQDIFVVGSGLKNESTDDSMTRGMAMGFKNSSNSEIAKKDAYLSLYLLFEVDENASQRSSMIPNLKISGRDNKGESVDFIYFSCEDKYIDVDRPYAMIIIKTYYDSESIELKINSKTYKVDLGLLKE